MVMGRKILYVEDDELARNILVDTLTDAGCSVSTAVEGSEGLVKIQEQEKPFDLIITGIFTTVLSGTDMIEIIRQTDSHTPILVVSGSGYEIGCELVKKGLASSCLSKPYKYNDLVNMVNLFLSDDVGTC